MLILIAISALVATLLGGLFAIRLHDKLHLILGFSAGAVVAVAFFDLLPESLELGSGFYSNQTIISIVAIGFIVYLVLDRLVFLHAHAHEDHEIDNVHNDIHKKYTRGILGATSLSLHSFLDGVAIGFAFQVSATVGMIVTIAVLTHDFSDGINTVNMILKNGGEKMVAFKWLLVDSIAPVLGIVFTLFLNVSSQILAIILALFSGFFLYIGASDLIPESHHAHPKFMTTAMTIFGMAILYLAIHFAG